jgi:tubulin--tyrosine ligase-like protein 12
MIRQVYEGATMKQPPRGYGNYPNSKAMYAIDLMLDWQNDDNNTNEKIIEPMICEINFMPDCTRV